MPRGAAGCSPTCLADTGPRHGPKAAIGAHGTFSADRIVAETNNGGEMVEATLRTVDRSVPYQSVRATRGKITRAEPIAALYEQQRVHHVGAFPQLEDQMSTFAPGSAGSPDRLDALVWALTELLVQPMQGWGVYEFYRREAEKLAAAEAAKRAPKPLQYAIGSMEWAAAQAERDRVP
jgi:phage terminase large subunit-like protein